MADKIPLFGSYGKGSAEASIDGDVIVNLEGDSLGPELGSKVLPGGGKAHQVLSFEGGPRWTVPPQPNFQEAIDKLAPLNQVYEETVLVGADEAGKHQVLPYHFPQAGELTFIVESEPIMVAQSAAGYFFTLDPRVESVVSGEVTYTQIGDPKRDYNFMVHWKTRNKVIGAVNDGNRVILYDVDVAKAADGLIGVITGLTAIAGLTALGDSLYALEAGGDERLYRIDVAHLRFVLAGSTSSTAHVGLISGTLISHSNRLLAIANRTGTVDPILVELNRNTGGITEVGGVLAFGNANSILALAEHRGLLYYWLTDGHTYRLVVDFEASTTTATSVGTASAAHEYAWVADVPLGEDSVVADAVAFNHLTAVSAGDAADNSNAWYETSKEWFFGRTADGRLTAGAVTAGSDMRPLRVFERTFTGGRPSRTKLISAPSEFMLSQTPRNIPLQAGGWEVGDRLQFQMQPWFHGEDHDNPLDSPVHIGPRHTILAEIDTQIMLDNNLPSMNYWIFTKNISINAAADDGAVMNVNAPDIAFGIRLETAHKNRITVLASWTSRQAGSDVMTVHQINRLR